MKAGSVVGCAVRIGRFEFCFVMPCDFFLSERAENEEERSTVFEQAVQAMAEAGDRACPVNRRGAC
jgi:hypothetical protein